MKFIENSSDDPEDDSAIEKRISDLLLAASTDSFDVAAKGILAPRERTVLSEENLAALMERYRHAELNRRNFEKTVSKLSAELLAHIGDRASEGSSCAQGSEADVSELCGGGMPDEADFGAAESIEWEQAGAGYRERLMEQRCTCSHLETRCRPPHEDCAESESNMAHSSAKLDSSVTSLASKTSGASSFFKNSCRLKEYNIHLESELTAMQQRLICAKETNERLERKLEALTLQLSKGEDVIAGLDRSRAELAEERNFLATKCETFERQLRLLQANICKPESQLQSMPGVHEEGPRVQNDLSQTMCSANEAMSNADEAQNKIMEDLRVFYDSILTKTKNMFDERLAILDERLSVSHAICQSSKPELAARDDEIREQKRALTEFRRQIESLMTNADVYSRDFKSGVQDRSVEQLTLLNNELREREGQLKDQVQLKRDLDGSLQANEAVNPREKQHLRRSKRGGARLMTKSGRNARILQGSDNNDTYTDDNSSEDPRSGSASDIEVSSGAKSARERLGHRVDVLFSKLFDLEKELESVREQNEASVNALPEGSKESDVLRSEAAGKSKQTTVQIERFKTPLSDRGEIKGSESEAIHDCEEQSGSRDIPDTSDSRDCLQDSKRDSSIMLFDEEHITDGSDSAALDEADEAKIRRSETESKLQAYEEMIQSFVRSCRKLAEAFELNVDPALEHGEFVTAVMREVREQYISRDADLKLRESAAHQLREELSQTKEVLETQLEAHKRSIQSLKETASVQAEAISEIESERRKLEDENQNLLRGEEKVCSIADQLLADKAILTLIGKFRQSLRTVQRSLLELTDELKVKCRELDCKAAESEALNADLNALRSENSKLNCFVALLQKRFTNCAVLPISEETDPFVEGILELSDPQRLLFDELVNLKTRLGAAVSETESLREQLRETDVALLASIDVADGLEKELTLKSEELEQLQQRLQASSEELRRVTMEDGEMKRRLEEELESIRKQLSACSSSKCTKYTSGRRSSTNRPLDIELRLKRKSERSRIHLNSLELEIEQLRTSLQNVNRSRTVLEKRCRELCGGNEEKDLVIERMTKQAVECNELLQRRKSEIGKIRRAYDELREELADAHEQVKNFEKHKVLVQEIQSTLGIYDFGAIVPFLERQGLIVSELGKGILKIRAELNGHESELDELRRTIRERQKDLTVIVAGAGEKLKSKGIAPKTTDFSEHKAAT